MELRLKLANWLSDGLLFALIDSEEEAWKQADEWRNISDKMAHASGVQRAALADVVAQEKPTSNATVKRMAVIARTALEHKEKLDD